MVAFAGDATKLKTKLNRKKKQIFPCHQNVQDKSFNLNIHGFNRLGRNFFVDIILERTADITEAYCNICKISENV